MIKICFERNKRKNTSVLYETFAGVLDTEMVIVWNETDR
jgi:hypothetical protein